MYNYLIEVHIQQDCSCFLPKERSWTTRETVQFCSCSLKKRICKSAEELQRGIGSVITQRSVHIVRFRSAAAAPPVPSSLFIIRALFELICCEIGGRKNPRLRWKMASGRGRRASHQHNSSWDESAWGHVVLATIVFFTASPSVKNNVEPWQAASF